MNANEIAEELEMVMDGYAIAITASGMLRQQQAEIEELKTCLIVEQEHNERMVEDRSKYEVLAHAGGVEAGKELKELTDEEIGQFKGEWYRGDYASFYDLVRAILRKAQEK